MRVSCVIRASIWCSSRSQGVLRPRFLWNDHAAGIRQGRPGAGLGRVGRRKGDAIAARPTSPGWDECRHQAHYVEESSIPSS